MSFSNAWDVFLLFAIPIGGGIPAGVILAKRHGLSVLAMIVLYFFSDVALACVLEPIIWLMILAGKKYLFFAKLNEAFRKTTNKTIEKYGIRPSLLTLVMVSFGVDPMTGRAAALAAGHHFVSGWALAIAGDMIFFTVIMVSTLFLNSILGDGTWTAVIIMVLMMVVPGVVRKMKEKCKSRS